MARDEKRGSTNESDRGRQERRSSEKPDEHRFAENLPEGRGTVAEAEYEDYVLGEHDSDSEEPDVLLDVPVVKVDEISLEVQELRARVSLSAEILDLLKLNVGADAYIGRVGLEIKGVEAQALLKVRLDNVARILDRVLTTIDRNPQILENITQGARSALEDVGGGAGQAAGELGKGAGDAVENVGQGAGEAVEDVGEGAGSAAEDVGEGAGEAAESAGEAAEDVGEGAGEAAESTGEAAEDVGKGARSAAEDTGEGAKEAAEDTGETARESGKGAGQAAAGAGETAGRTAKKGKASARRAEGESSGKRKERGRGSGRREGSTKRSASRNSRADS